MTKDSYSPRFFSVTNSIKSKFLQKMGGEVYHFAVLLTTMVPELLSHILKIQSTDFYFFEETPVFSVRRMGFTGVILLL